MTKPSDQATELVRLAGAVVDAVVEQETQALHLMQAELAALAQVVGVSPLAAAPARPDAEIEASFDNMPI